MRDWMQLSLLLAIAAGLVVLGARIVLRVRRTPKDPEQRRRLAVNLGGRLGNATITEADNGTLYYEYSIGGVAYTASQDVSKLGDHLPENLEQLIGRPVSLKYTPRNPANSIIVCEDWSGLRV
jgi:hypothetical protein